MDNEKSEQRNEVSHEEDFAALLAKYNETATQLKPGNIVQGKIVGIFDTDILVDAGGRSEGILKREEITGPDGNLLYGEGDTILVMLESGTGSDQQLRVSYRKASRARKQAVI